MIHPRLAKWPPAAIIAGVIGLVLGCGSTGGARQSAINTPDSAAPSSVAGAAAATAQDPVATALNAYCQQTFPDTYAGLELQSAQHDIIVYRRPTPGFDDTVRSRFPSARVVFRDARFSQRYLQQLTQRVLADAPYWRSHNIDIATVGPMADGSGVQIGTPQGSSARAALEERYGADRIYVVRRVLDLGVASPTG